MTKGEFWEYYLNNLNIGIFYGIILVLINFWIFRKYIYSIFDPFTFTLIMSSIAYSVVFFLYHLNLISNYYFFSFIITQTAFFIGFFVFKPINKKKIYRKFQAKKLYFGTTAKYLYLLSALLWIVSQGIVYYSKGIPLLMESRLETYTGGTGFGIFNRIISITSTIALSIAIFRIFYYQFNSSILSRWTDYFIVLFSIIVALLSGSKSELMNLIFIMFFVMFYNYKTEEGQKTFYAKKQLQKKQWHFFFLSVVLAIFTIIVQSTLKYGNENKTNPLISLLMRLVNSGDIYMYAYPNAFLEKIPKANPFLAFFKDLIGMFRIMPWDALPEHLGLQLNQNLYHTDLILGPNARHNVFGLHYFGFTGSIFFSFFLGMVVSFLRNKIYFIMKTDIISMIIYILLAQHALTFETDPSYALSKYVNILVVFLPLWVISYILAKNQNLHSKN